MQMHFPGFLQVLGHRLYVPIFEEFDNLLVISFDHIGRPYPFFPQIVLFYKYLCDIWPHTAYRWAQEISQTP